MTDPHALKPRTIAAQALGAIEPETKGVALPLHVSTTFIRDPDNQYRTGYVYGRPDNATVRQTEAVIAALEGAADAMLFGSGMSAATSIVLALPAGAHVLAPKVMYWSLRNWLTTAAARFGYRVDLVDMEDLAAVRAAMRPETKLVWIETPANPLWGITDIAAVAEIAHKGGAILAVDSTVATPLFCRPLSLGADIVMHSATKYLNGHSDVIAGALAAPRATDEFWAQDQDRCARSTARSSGHSRHGSCCVACARLRRACAPRPRAPTCWPRRFANHASVSSRALSGTAIVSPAMTSRSSR